MIACALLSVVLAQLGLVGQAGQVDVDMTLTPATQNVPVGCIAEVELELVLASGSSASVSAIDALVSWDPAQLSLVAAVPSGTWFAAGFLNDPDDINEDLTDGDALFTALAAPLAPVELPPTATIVTFEFLVLDAGQVSLLPSLGTFGSSQVLGTTPGEDLTGALSGPVSITAESGTWTDLGGGAAGSNGTPTAVGTGALAEGCPTTVSLSNAPPNAMMIAWISFAPAPFPALGGTVHAFPFASQLFLAANGSGEFSASTTWPPGVPPSTSLWIQFIVADASTPDGLTLSNGLRATTPSL